MISKKYAERLKKKTKPDQSLLGFFAKNPITAFASSATFIGLLFIYFYHFHINYFPAFDLKAFASTIFSASFVGFIFLFVCAVPFFLPAAIVVISFLDQKSENNKEKAQDAGGYLIVSLISFPLLILILTTVEISRVATTYFGLLPAMLLAFLLIRKAFRHKFSKGVANDIFSWGKKNTTTLWYCWKISILWALQFFPALICLIILEGSPKLKQIEILSLEFYDIVIYTMLIINVTSGYLVIAWRFNVGEHHRLYSILAACVTPLLFTFLVDGGSAFPAKVASATKIGNFYASEITLSKDGCDVLNNTAFKPCSANDGVYKVCGVYVASRLGSETYIQAPYLSPDGEQKIASYYVRSKDLIGMVVDNTHKFYNIDAGELFLKSASVGCHPSPRKTNSR